MQAFVHEEYGSPDVLHMQEVPTPVPTDDQVLVRIYAVSINGSDREGLIGEPLYARMRGLAKPGLSILGSDIAGRVAAVGKNITEFKVGEEVFGEVPGYQNGFAEYAVLPETNLLPRPAGLTLAQASCIPQAGVIALQGIRKKGNVQPGQQVLINGAGGSTGLFAVPLAKLAGAEVTGVDNTRKLDYMRSLGADHVIDSTRQDFTKTGKQYDFILDVIAHRSAFAYARALKPNGTYYCVGGSVGVLLQCLVLGPLIQKLTSKSVRVLIVEPNKKDLSEITQMCQEGKIPIRIDKQFPFRDLPEAMRYVAEGRAKGKVVITYDE